MSLYDSMIAKAKQAWQYAGQVPAGAVSGTLADSHVASDVAARKALDARRIVPHLPGPIELIAGRDYRPAIVDQLPALYGIIKSVTGHQVDPNSIPGKAIERSNAANDRTNKVLHVKDPQNAAQMGLNVLGSLAVPGLKIPKASAASKGGRLLQNAGRVALETALPLRNTGVKTALATQIPLGVGLREGIDAIAPSDEYHGVADLVHQNEDPFAGIDATPVLTDPFSELDATNDPFADLDAPDLMANADSHELSTLEKGIVGASVVGAAGLGAHFSLKALQNIKSIAPPIDALAGSRVIKSRSGPLTKLQTATMQHDQPIRNVADEFLSVDAAARFKFNSDRIIPQALGAKIKNAMVTGELPGSSVKVKPLAPLLQSMAKDLDPTERQMVSNNLLASSTLDDFRASGVQPSMNDKTPVELQQMVDIVANDPKLSKYADAVREQYKGLLDYRHDMGFIDAKQYNEFRAKRPNYVHMSKDVTREGGPKSLFSGSTGNQLGDEQLARQMEEFGGTQVGATRDPIDELQGRYADTIRMAQLNEHKRELFSGLMQTNAPKTNVPTSDGAAVKLIQEVDEPKSMEGIHTVWDQGRARYYKIGDPLLDRALQYSPRATAGVLGTMRQIAQFFTTGAGNPLSMFGATVSPMYDTLSGMVLRPAGTDIGVVNEVLNRVGSPINLGRLDPTILATAPIGALRSMFDELTGAAATSLSDQLLRDHGVILSALGPQRTAALRGMLKSRYDSSIRSILDAEGVSSHQQWGSDSGLKTPIGMEHIAPAYASDLSSRVTAEALKGNHSLYEGVLARGNNAFAQAKSSLIARMYSGVLRNMQEGFRYQFAATNLPKVKSMRDLNELMSTTRRIASDTGQYGGGDAWNKVADSVMYANVGTQALNEWSRRFAAAPVHTISNIATTVATLAALRYGAMIADPDVADKVNLKTDAQNTSSITTFGGVELPVEPLLRVLTGPLFATLDAIAMDENGAFNPNFVDAVHQYFDDEDAQERGGQASKDAFWAGLQAAAPLSPSGLPLGNALMSAAGIDPGMTRVTGEPMAIRVQKQSALAGEGKTTDSMMNAYFGKIIESVLGSGITNLIDTADQWQRAAFSQNGDGRRGTSPTGAAKVALSQLIDSSARTTGPAQSLLFGDYEKVHSIADTDFNLYQGKRDGIDKATSIFNQDIKNAYTTGSDPRTALLRPQDLVPPDLTQTALAPIGVITLDLMKTLRKMEAHTSALTKQTQTVLNQKTTRIEDRNKQINEINKERRYMYVKMLQVTRQAEDQIGTVIGDEGFTYQHFDPKKYVPSTDAPPQ